MIQWARAIPPLGRGSIFYFSFWGMVAIYAPFLNVYFRTELGFSGREIGFLALIIPVMTIVVAMPLAAFADKRRQRRLVLSGLLICLAVLLIFAHYPQTFPTWMVFMTMWAILFSPLMPLADSIVARMAERYRLNYGTMRLFGSIGFAIIAIGCGFVWERVGYQWMFLATALSMLPLLWWTTSLDESGASQTTAEIQPAPSIRYLFQDAGLVVLYLTTFMVGLAVQSSVMFDGLYMQSVGGTERFIGLMFGFSALCELPTMQYSGAIIKRLGGPRTLFVAYVLFCSAYIGYIVAWNPWVLLLMTGVKGLGFGLFYVSAVQLLTTRTPESWAATAQAVFTVCGFGFAPILASLIGGELYDNFGPQKVYFLCSIALGIAIVIMAVAIQRGIFKDAPMTTTVSSTNAPQTCI